MNLRERERESEYLKKSCGIADVVPNQTLRGDSDLVLVYWFFGPGFLNLLVSIHGFLWMRRGREGKERVLREKNPKTLSTDKLPYDSGFLSYDFRSKKPVSLGQQETKKKVKKLLAFL